MLSKMAEAVVRLCLILSTSLSVSVRAYGTGAPCVAQHSLQPSLIFHGTSQDLITNPPPYAFSVENADGKRVTSYKPGKVYTIRVTAKNHFRGFLVQPRVATKPQNVIGTLRAGEFLPDPTWESQGIQHQPCQPKSNDSVTHTSNDKKTRLAVKWKVGENVGPVQFILTLVAEQSIFWEAWQPDTGYLTPEGAGGDGGKQEQKSTATTSDSSEFAVTVSTKHKAKRPKTTDDEQQQRDDESDLRDSGSSGSSKEKDKKPEPDVVSLKTEITNTELRTTKKPSSSEARAPSADPCSENDCKNGAVCQIVGTGYSCKCKDGFVGKFCQWQCPSYLCQNGGTCSIDPSSNYVCTCAEGFTGNHCEESKTKSKKSSNKGSSSTKSASSVESKEDDKNETTKIVQDSKEEDKKETTTKSVQENNNKKNEQDEQQQQAPPKLSNNKSVAKQSVKIVLSTTRKPNSDNGDDFDTVALLRGSAGSPPDSAAIDSSDASNDKAITSNNNGGEIERNGGGGGGNETDFAEITTEEPISTTTQAPVNPFVARLVEKLIDNNGVVFNNGLRDIKNPDPCEDNQCTNGAKCEPNNDGSYKCLCQGEYDGPFCQWDCPSYLCRNGGKCFIDDNFNYLCVCKTGYSGPHCEKKNFTEPDEANATDVLFSIKHLFTGDQDVQHLIESTFNHTVETFDTNILKELSENRIDAKKRLRFIKAANLNKNVSELVNILIEPDYCSAVYCYNDGLCLINSTAKVGYCNCSDGWTGDTCNKKDFCADNKCDHGSLCINEDTNYTCQCKGEFAGRFCSVPCPPTLCSNNGKCLYDDGKHKCACQPGFAGDRCQLEIDECESEPCLNGGTCSDKHNGFTCKCSKGFMGSRCHRPCEDVYKEHCKVWSREDRCESHNSNTSQFFNTNCPLSCKLCEKSKNVSTSSFTNILPPVLESLDFLVGKWIVNSSDAKHFPFDYVKTSGYYEELEIIPGDFLLFGSPALNYSSIAIGNDNSTEVVARAGFLSTKSNGTNQTVNLMSIGNDGLTIMEDGVLAGEKEIILISQFVKIDPDVENKIPIGIKRSLALSGAYLRESLERRYNDSTTDYYTKYYSKKTIYEVY